MAAEKGDTNLRVKFVVAQVEGCVDCFKRLEIDVHFLFFAFICDDSAAVEHKPIGRNCAD